MLTYLCFQLLALQARANAPDLEVTISSIAPSMKSEAHDSESLLSVNLKNNTGKRIRVLLSAVTGKGGTYLMGANKKPSAEMFLEGKPQPAAGCCAILEYAWLDQDKKRIASGTTNLSGDMLDISQGCYETLQTSIKSPTHSGNYTLEITFRNNDLAPFSRGTNSATIDSHISGPLIFTKASTRADIEIKSLP